MNDKNNFNNALNKIFFKLFKFTDVKSFIWKVLKSNSKVFRLLVFSLNRAILKLQIYSSNIKIIKFNNF